MQRSFQAFKHTLKLVVFRRGALDLIPKFLRKKRKEKFRLNMDNRVPPPSLLFYFIVLFVFSIILVYTRKFGNLSDTVGSTTLKNAKVNRKLYNLFQRL